MRLAPSSSEYSVRLWRWTKVSGACCIVLAGLAGPRGIVYWPQVPYTIRPATVADQPTIRRMVRDAGINPMNLKWPNFLVAADGRAIVGIGQVKAHRDGSRELASMAVVKERQGHGIGGAIVNALIASQGDRTLYLTCRRQLEGYYERFGFRRIERQDHPAYFARMLPVVNLFARLARMEIILMRRPG
ncbi:MAG: GNAT family N-acetyltransferase [Chloroflexi bacterium]|nr:MAG: GNAT family N-acetyltransferase [Chloroflexota bacterium]